MWVNHSQRAIALLVLVLAPGCALFAGKAKGPEEVHDLVGSIERVYVDSELARERTSSAVTALESIASQDFGDDSPAAYADFVARVEAAEEAAEQLSDSIDPMKDASRPVFDKWEDEIKQFSSASMRARSEDRLAETRKRYDEIVDAADRAVETLAEVNQGLRDHALFLSHDFNAQSINAIQADVRTLASRARELELSLETCMTAARGYVENSALPETAPLAASSNEASVSSQGEKEPAETEVKKVSTGRDRP